MINLPLLSGRAIIKALAKLGYYETRRRSSHMRLSCPDKKSVTVPDYKQVGHGLLRKILRDADLSPAEFIKLLE